ncbi:hypothetical protein NXS98_05290 [Fontisphaera persica]|uniref:hypothetical protein n=1 Tax=Fontisphaera persica TaxID=2974023 RepID=UPI0024C020AC|nr:hypothetical protein [Fontisphaera persica]WCJ60545.1 hypothetical protein NXS98_05290 [Fontisphaera persica]
MAGMFFWRFIVATTAVLLTGAGVVISLDTKEEKLPGKSITERNAFNLKAPAPPAPPPAPPPPATKVNLTGVFSIMGNKRAILQISEPGKAAPESRIMQEGDKEGDIEVLAIDTAAETVRVKIRDQEKELDFKKDGITPPTAPAAAFAMPTNMALLNKPPVQGLPGGALNATTGIPMPIQPPPNLQPGAIWRPDGSVIPPGAAVTNPVPNPAATLYQPPTRVIRTP